MRDEDGGDGQAPLQREQVAAHLHAQALVEVGQRLVEQQQPWLDDQGARQRDALLLATRELAGAAARMFAQAHHVEHGADLAARCRFVHASLDQAEGHVVPHAQVRPQRIALEDHPDAALPRRQAADVDTIDQHLPALLAHEAGDDAQQRALARTRGPEQREEFARRHVQAQAFEHIGTALVGQADVAADEADGAHALAATRLAWVARVAPVARCGAALSSMRCAM